MNLKLNILLILLFSVMTLGFTCSPNSILKSVYDLQDVSIEDPNKLPSFCTDKLNYQPDLKYPDHSQMKYVRVNFHVINNKKEDLAISKNESKKFLRMMIDSANYWLAHNQKMFLPNPNNTPVLPTNFRYVLTGDPKNPSDDGIYYHVDDEMCYVNSARNAKKETHSIFTSKQYDKYGVQKEEVLNIFILEHHPDSLARKKKYKKINGVGSKNWVKITGIKPRFGYLEEEYKRKKTGKAPLTRNASHFGRFLNHEIGHSLGLSHTWGTNDGCDDTPKHNNCWAYNKKDPGCDEWEEVSNNVMDYNTQEKSYSPCQISKVQYNLMKEGSSQRQKLITNWCTYDKSKSITINSGNNVVWSNSKDIEGDIIIKNNASLKIECLVSIPKNGKIIIHEKGTLSLGTNAHITNRCGDLWGGIEVWDDGKRKGTLKIGEGASVSKVAPAPNGSSPNTNKNLKSSNTNKSSKTGKSKNVLKPKKDDKKKSNQVLKKKN